MAAGELITLPSYADVQKYNFFRPPSWRWERVLSLVDRPGEVIGRCTRRDDRVVRAAKSFAVRRQSADQMTLDRLQAENPALFYAYDFHQRAQDDPEAALYIQARLLARQTPEQVADVMGITADTVTWYADLFFDVIPYLDKRDWITKQVLVPAMLRSGGVAPPGAADAQAQPFRDSTVARPFMDGTLKLFAYFGGPHLVDVMIAGLQAGRPLTSVEDMDNWFDRTVATTVRRRTAQAATMFEVNKYNVMELFAVHSRIMEIERSEESQEQARTTTERHVKALMDEIPWAVGGDGEELYDGTAVGRFDRMSSELRDDELLLVAGGRPAPTVAPDNFPAALPPPRKDKRSVLTIQEPEL